MRAFTDAAGGSWEVVAGRESWGAIVAIFVSIDREEPVRQVPLRASGYEDGNAELDAHDLDGLRQLLERSVPKEL